MATLSENRQAKHDYDVAETYTAGVVLSGHEAKSAKLGRMDIAGSRAVIRGGEAYLVGASIHSFQPANAPDGYDATRTRKLLLSHDELRYLTGKLESGLTLVPLEVYTHRALVKVKLGLGRIRKKHDKREVIKKREVERELRRART